MVALGNKPLVLGLVFRELIQLGENVVSRRVAAGESGGGLRLEALLVLLDQVVLETLNRLI